MKSASAMGIGLTLGGVGTLNVATLPVRAASSPNKHWEDEDYNSVDSAGTEYRNAASHSAGWYGATYETDPPYDGKWKHIFRHNSNARTGSIYNGDEQEESNVSEHQTTWDHVGASALNDVSGYNYYGVAPTPSGSLADNADFQRAKWVAKYAIGKLNPWLAAGFTAAEFIEVMIQEDHEGPSGHHQDTYDYTNNHHDTGHFRWMDMYVSPGSLAQYTMDSSASDALMTDPSVSIRLEIDGGSDPTDDLSIGPSNTMQVGGESTTNVWQTNQNTVVYERNDGWTIERIPEEMIRSRGQSLNWRDEEIEKRLNQNEPVFFAHNAGITRTG